jgi:hypothetical protein
MLRKKESDAALLARVTEEMEKPRITKSVREQGQNKLLKGTSGAVVVESVADILEREVYAVIEEWLIRVEKEPDLMSIPMIHEERTGHLPHLLHEVIGRLRLDAKMRVPISKTAGKHGNLRHKQGYTVAMAVQESRLLHGLHLFNVAQKHRAFGNEPTASRRCDHRGRSGCPIEGTDAGVHGRKIQVEIDRRNDYHTKQNGPCRVDNHDKAISIYPRREAEDTALPKSLVICPLDLRKLSASVTP